MLNLANYVPNTEAEGPGLRFAVWAQGCDIGCPGCCNPHIWSFKPNIEMSAEDLFLEILRTKEKHPALEGITLIGGEPTYQAKEFSKLCDLVHSVNMSVMTFTGRLLEDLIEEKNKLVECSDLLVDGKYLQELRTEEIRWIGSTNQRLHFLSSFYSPDDPRFKGKNHAELRINSDNEVQIVGFPFKSIIKEMRKVGK